MRFRGPPRGSSRYVPGGPSAIMEGTVAQRLQVDSGEMDVLWLS